MVKILRGQVSLSLSLVASFLVVSFALTVTPALANVGIDQVQSAHLREADGTSGQDTNSGAGVKSNHIQDGAITAAKIANGAVTSDKFAEPVYTRAEVNAMLADLQVQIATLQDLLQHFSRNGDEITISGANLKIVNGSGSTDGTVNGLGNLIVGYNEQGSPVPGGSHNIVLGMYQNYASYGGFLAGFSNIVTAPFGSVCGGQGNTVSGFAATISGGETNYALGTAAAVRQRS